MRIISLIASATEIVCALGYEDELVGRSHECDYPPSIVDLPVTTRPRFETGGSSKEIDDRVKAQVSERAAEDALGVYEVFPDKLRELEPTHIITQTQCEVCAVSLKDVEVAVRELTGFDAQIVSLKPNTLEDVYADFRRVANAIDDSAAGLRLVSDCRKPAPADRAGVLPTRASAARRGHRVGRPADGVWELDAVADRHRRR